jgi:hypothetical protein
MNFFRTVGCVHIVVVSFMTGLQTGKDLTAQAAAVLLYCRLMAVTGSKY